MSKQFDRILRLVEKTGDRMVVWDRQQDKGFVVMDLENYEQMLELKPVAANESEDSGGGYSQKDIWNLMQSAKDAGETWSLENLSNEERAELERQYKAHVSNQTEKEDDNEQERGTEDKGNPKNVPTKQEEKKNSLQSGVEVESGLEVGEQVQKVEESTEKQQQIDEDDEFGEEQFYLEPVE